jgi:hypothetical protein
MTKRVGARFLLLVLVCMPIAASAQDLRAVVLPKLTVEGQAGDAAALEAAVTVALQKRGLRIVDLPAALSAQKAAFSDSVLAGKIPQELSVLNADAILSAQLNCSKSADSILNSEIKAYYCVLTQKVVRVDSGDVAFSDSQDWTAHGLNGLQALQGLMKGRLPAVLDERAGKWLGAWKGEGGWHVDLLVAKLSDRDAAEKLATALARVPGVTGARLVVTSPSYAKFTLSGAGSADLQGLPKALESTAGMSLKVTYATERVIHAEFSFEKAYARSVAVYFTPPATTTPKSPGRIVAERGPEIIKAYLGNLGYLQVERVEAVAGQALTGAAARSRKAAELKKEGVPLLLAVSFGQGKGEWISTFDLIASADGATVATALGRAVDPLTAVEKAAHQLDAAYRLALANKQMLSRVGLAPGAAGAAAERGLVVESFSAGQVFPTRLPTYREKGIGTLTLKNVGKGQATDGEVRFSIRGAVVSTARLAGLGPGAVAEVPIALNELPKGTVAGTQYMQIEAAVTYRVGETYRKTDAYAPLIVHQDQTIDWTEPRSVAAFIDATNPAVRALASKAVIAAKPSGAVLKKVALAEAVYGALWHAPLQYVTDPVTTNFGSSIDSVQHPAQTLARAAGDCDDLTVLLASLYESVGLATAIIITPSHVLLGVESGMLVGGHLALGLPKAAFIEVDGAQFIPVEATAVGSGFADAWVKGAEVVAQAGGKPIAFRTREAWTKNPPFSRSGAEGSLQPELTRVTGADAAFKVVGGRFKGPVPAWSKALAEQIAGAGIVSIEPGAIKGEPLAAPIVAWLRGDRAKGINETVARCKAESPEACYNLEAMLLLETDRAGIDAASAEVDAAAAWLPEPVRAMLVDRGGMGLGDESTAEAKAKKKMDEAVKKAQVLLKKKELHKKMREIKIAPVGGRKGAPAVGPDAAAMMFFWAKVND